MIRLLKVLGFCFSAILSIGSIVLLSVSTYKASVGPRSEFEFWIWLSGVSFSCAIVACVICVMVSVSFGEGDEDEN